MTRMQGLGFAQNQVSLFLSWTRARLVCGFLLPRLPKTGSANLPKLRAQARPVGDGIGGKRLPLACQTNSSVSWLVTCSYHFFIKHPLPESKALPSVEIFAECLLSGTRQRRLCRVPHSVKLYSRQRGSLPSAGHLAQADTRQRLVCRVPNTRQRGLSAKGRQRPSQS
jgi:hypothetical protein